MVNGNLILRRNSSTSLLMAAPPRISCSNRPNALTSEFLIFVPITERSPGIASNARIIGF